LKTASEKDVAGSWIVISNILCKPCLFWDIKQL